MVHANASLSPHLSLVFKDTVTCRVTIKRHNDTFLLLWMSKDTQCRRHKAPTAKQRPAETLPCCLVATRSCKTNRSEWVNYRMNMSLNFSFSLWPTLCTLHLRAQKRSIMSQVWYLHAQTPCTATNIQCTGWGKSKAWKLIERSLHLHDFFFLLKDRMLFFQFCSVAHSPGSYSVKPVSLCWGLRYPTDWRVTALHKACSIIFMEPVAIHLNTRL